jgi:hypothetical protein
MKLWKYVEAHHDELGCLWFIVPLAFFIPLLAVLVNFLLPVVG